MDRVSFLIITAKGTQLFEFGSTLEEISEILDVIGGKPVEWFEGSSQRRMFLFDTDFKAKLDGFANKFGSGTNTRPYELRKFMNMNLSDGEFFYMFRTGTILRNPSQIELAHAVYQLVAKQRGLDKDALWDGVKEKMETLFNVYSIQTLGTVPYASGEATENRVCRFCGRTKAEGATFGKVAHAISKALGNDTLKCNEECDHCNETLAHVEDNLSVGYLEIRRSLCGIQGRGGVNSVAGQNFVLDAKSRHMQIGNGVTLEDIGNRFRVKLEGREIFTIEGLYKALAKIVIDLVSNELLPHFKNTIDWINGKLLAEEYPKIKQYYSNRVYRQPILELFIRKNDKDVSYGPYCFAHLFVCDMVLEYVVPFVDVDMGRVKNQNMIAPYEDLMQTTLEIYKLPGEWIEGDIREQRTAFIILELQKGQPAEDGQPAEISENLHMMPPKWETDSISFPDFDSSNILSVSIIKSEVSNVNRNIVVDEEWLHDTSNNIATAFIIDEENSTIRVNIGFEMCNTDNTEHFLEANSSVEFSIGDLTAVLQVDNDVITLSKRCMTYLVLMTLGALNPPLKKVHKLIDVTKLNADLICERAKAVVI